MPTFLIFVLITLIVSCRDFKDAVKSRQAKLIAFYSVFFGLSLALAALHCMGVSFDIGGIIPNTY